MKVYVNGIVYDADKENIIIVFKNDEERKTAASNLTNMEERSGVRCYATFPDDMDKNKVQEEVITASKLY